MFAAIPRATAGCPAPLPAIDSRGLTQTQTVQFHKPRAVDGPVEWQEAPGSGSFHDKGAEAERLETTTIPTATATAY